MNFSPIAHYLNTYLLQILGSHIGPLGAAKERTSTKIQFFELNLDISTGQPVLAYTGWSRMGNEIDLKDLDSLLAECIKKEKIGDHDGNDPKPKPTGKPHFEDFPNGSERTSLGLRSMGPCLYVVYLSKTTNWQFNRRFSPFSIGESKNLATLQSIFTEPNLLTIDWNDDLVRIDTPAQELPNGRKYPSTRWASFYYDGNNTTHFAYRFNIHVELFDPITKNYVALVIDPDVGHPGGNGGG